MKVVQVGLGEFGWSWLRDVVLPHTRLDVVGIVDCEPRLLDRAAGLTSLPTFAAFTSLEGALEAITPDFVLNVTPPHAHTAVVRSAVARGVPVLSEKPITEDYGDALELLRLAESAGVPVVIAENYRYSPVMRTTKALLCEGRIGEVQHVEITFRRWHQMENYHARLRHPLLLDVAVHHFDLLRYLTGLEAYVVSAGTWVSSPSAYAEHSNAEVTITLQQGVSARYDGSLDTPDAQTDWNGVWRVQGQRGRLMVKDGVVYLNGNPIFRADSITSRDSREFLVDAFLSSLQRGTRGETDVRDNIKSFALTCAATRSAKNNRPVSLSEGML